MCLQKTIILFATVCALAHAAPVRDPYQDASSTVSMLLQQGQDESDCADLAVSIVDELINKVNSINAELEALDTGSSCKNEGREAVDQAQQRKDHADARAMDAATAASSATSATVDFGSFPLSDLNEGECGQFWTDNAYEAAKVAVDAADTAKTLADAEATAAAGGLETAITAAAKAIKSCQCDVRAAYGACMQHAVMGPKPST